MVLLPPRSTLFPYTTLFPSVPTTLPTAYDVYPLGGRHDGGYYIVKDCVTIDGIITTIMRSEERFSRNAETGLVCRVLLEKKKKQHSVPFVAETRMVHTLSAV